MKSFILFAAIFVAVLHKFANAHASQHRLLAAPLALAKRNALLFSEVEKEVGTRYLNKDSIVREHFIFQDH